MCPRIAGASVMSVKAKYELPMGAATREAFGKALVEVGRMNPNVVALDADLSKSTYTAAFAKEFPGRFFECGIAEMNMLAIGSGLASAGKIPFASTFSVFALNKGFEQMRVTAAFPNVNLKVVGTHSGISIGEDGPSQMSVEDRTGETGGRTRRTGVHPSRTTQGPANLRSRSAVHHRTIHRTDGGLGCD